MDTRPLRTLMMANMAVCLLACAAFFLHYLGVGLYPDGMELWFQHNQWLVWTAAALTVVSALVIPVLSLFTQQSGDDR
ncbi:hypothetical protein LHJ74_23760 [Streptomyces sp. N2-109]|uniref:DUF2798 domain-containing protein n=1 Tax=Streptomyces gossypii TaxID=2883101 RepID=A0ABT2JZ01_9ACTN|nr:hypothetical protein [Streptomyces gossypii]MCT2592893.1 hypothetical protein [Streptomyces gossypii]